VVGRTNNIISIGRYLTLGLVAVTMLFPLLWMFRVAFLLPSAGTDLAALTSSDWTFKNFQDLFTQADLGRALFNSVLVGGVVTLGNIIFCFTAAYGIARYHLLTHKLLFGAALFVLMIPGHIVIIPLYLICLKAGIYDSYWALILPWLVNPIGIFLVKQYIEALPPSMEEAARVDGAGELRIILRIVMPLCKPALAVLAIQVFFTNWNSFLFPFILTSRTSLHTLPVALSLYQGHQAIDWPHLMAGSTVAVVPVLIVFLFMQKRIVSGITAGAVKQ
jgi:multiple sugar transport system permease protein